MPEVITTQEALELLDFLVKIAIDPDSVDTEELEEAWPNERVALYLEAIKGIVYHLKNSGLINW